MNIKVRLYATLSDQNPEGRGNEAFTVRLPDQATVADLIEQLGIDIEDVKQVFIRHKARPFDHKLTDGDQVAIFPPVAGG